MGLIRSDPQVKAAFAKQMGQLFGFLNFVNKCCCCCSCATAYSKTYKKAHWNYWKWKKESGSEIIWFYNEI